LTGIWLGIDTASALGGVALLRNGELVMESILPVTSFHSEKLLPAVSVILQATETSGPDLAGIGVSIGPGSYTGLRIGVATSMGLAAGWGVPVKGISTLRVIASCLPEGPVLSCMKARKGEVFAGAFESPDPLSPEIIPQGLYSAGALEELISGEGYLACGNGRSEISSSKLRWASSLMDHSRPSLTAACACALAALNGFDSTLEPLYLRGFNQRIVTE